MMEFILSRWTMAICGMLLLSAVASSFALLNDDLREEIAWNIFSTIDHRLSEAMELGMEIHVRMTDVFPSAEWSAVIDGMWLNVSDGDGEWRYPLGIDLGSGTPNRIPLGIEDVLVIHPSGMITRI
jgi:hypothetical protein